MLSKGKNKEKSKKPGRLCDTIKIVLLICLFFSFPTATLAATDGKNFHFSYLFLLAFFLIIAGFLFYYRKDCSIPFVSSNLRIRYFKTKFKITLLKNSLAAEAETGSSHPSVCSGPSCGMNLLPPRGRKIDLYYKKIKLFFYQGYLKILYYFILISQNSHESFEILREDLEKTYENKKASQKMEWVDLKNLTEKVKQGKIKNTEILEDIILKLYNFHLKNKRRAMAFSMASVSLLICATVVSGLITSLIFPNILKSWAATTYTFNQTDWSGGASVSTASHTSDQSGWNKYSSKDAGLSAGTELTMATSSLTIQIMDVTLQDITQDQYFTLSSESSWAVSTIDQGGDVGQYSSLAIDSNNKSHIAYYDNTNKKLLYAQNTSGSWATSTISSGNVGQYCSIAIDSDNYVHVSFYDTANEDLRYVTNSSGLWVTTLLDSEGSVGKYTSIKIGDHNAFHISYYDETNNALKCVSDVYGFWDIETIDSGGVTGKYTSIALDSNDKMRISYFSNNDLKCAIKNTTWSTSVLDEGNESVFGNYSSLAIDSLDDMHISHYDSTSGSLRLVSSMSPAMWTNVTVESGNVGSYSSIAVDSDNQEHISYYDEANGNLKYWTNWVITAVDDSPNDVGKYTSIALDSNDNPYISYYDETNGDLKYASNIATYESSGTITSSLVTVTNSSFGKLSWEEIVPENTSIIMKVRSCESSDCSGTPDFASCDAVNNNEDISANNCINDGDQYFQYQATLSTTDQAATPKIKDIMLTYEFYSSYMQLISSPYNTLDPANAINKIEWTENIISGATDVKFQLRTAATSAGLSTASFTGPGGAATYYTDPSGQETIAAAHRDGLNDQWFQYKALMTSTGSSTPTLSDITISYAINTAPEINSSPSASQSGNTVAITYEIRDSDTIGGANPGFVTPSFQYWDGAQWQPCQTVADGDEDDKIVEEEAYTSYTAHWNAKEDFPNQSVDTQIKILIDDGEQVNNISSSTTSLFSLDTLAPSSPSITVDASSTPALLILSASGDDPADIQMKISLASDLTGASWQSYNSHSTITLQSDPDTVYVKFKDAYENETSIVHAATPQKPTNLIYHDISNSQDSIWREFIAWKSIPAPAPGFKRYNIFRSAGGNSYSLLTTIDTLGTNYYIDTGVENSNTYYYKINAEDSDNNISFFTAAVSDKPDGQGGTDVTSPTISNVATSSISTTQATITWDTDEISDSAIGYSPTPGTFTTEIGVSTMADTAAGIGTHSVTLTGLLADTSYYFQVKSIDPSGNIATSTQSADGYTFTTKPGASISNVTAADISNTSAVITWITDTESDSYIVYSTNSDLSFSTQTGNATLTTNHSVSLLGISSGVKYYYYVKSTDASSHLATDNNGGNYYSFTTTQDTSGPIISAVSESVVTDTTAVISWATDEVSTSKVQYGIASGTYNAESTENTNLDISHSVKLSSLAADTTYYYHVISRDASSNTSTSTEKMFTTLEILSEETEVQARETAAENQGKASVSGGGVLVIEKTDQSSPMIFNEEISQITASNALISWVTDEDSNSFVEYGETSNYAKTFGNYDFTKSHSVTLENLNPGSIYHYNILSADKEGNIAKSGDKDFTTLQKEEITSQETESPKETGDLNPGENLITTKEGQEISKEELLSTTATAAQKAMDIISQISSQISISTLEPLLSNQYESIQQISQLIPAPIMRGEPRVVTTANTAMISWETDKEANSLVALAPEDNFNAATGENSYLQVIGNPATKTREHIVTIYDLEPDTTYHFQLRSQGDIGPTAQSDDFTFTTKSEALEINGHNVEINSPENATFKWITNLPTSAQIKYTPYRNNTFMVEEAKIKKDSAISIVHEITLDDLEAGVTYEIELSGKDIKDKLITKSIPSFSTSEEDLPPIIYQVKTESTISPGKSTKIQTIVFWMTNEPATSRVYYEKGISSDEVLKESTSLDNSFTKKHVMIITQFDPGAVYRFKVESMDSGGNVSLSDTFSVLTPHQQETVFQVIMKNIEKTFNWVGKIKE